MFLRVFGFALDWTKLWEFKESDVHTSFETENIETHKIQDTYISYIIPS